MSRLSPDQASAFAREWIEAWNAHDLDAIMSHYAEEIVFHSPRIAAVMGNGAAFVAGKAALRDYWKNGFAKAPDLHFEMQRVYLGSDALTIGYRNHRGQYVTETFLFGGDGLVTLSIATYSER